MYLLLNFFAATFVHIAFFFATAKVMTQNYKFSQREILFVLLATSVTSSIRALVFLVDLPNLSAAIFSGATYIAIIFLHGPALFLYFFKIHACDVKRSLAFVFSVTSVVLLTDVIVDSIYIVWFPEMRLTVFTTILEYPFKISMHFLLHIFLSFICSVVFARLLSPTLLSPDINKKTKKLFLTTAGVVCAVITVGVTIFYSLEYTFIEEDWSLNIAFVITFLYFILFGIIAHTKFVEIKHESKLKEEALSSLQRYMADLEQQQLAIRKFKHDYQNILLPMQGFIKNEQWEDLKKYFSSEVMISSEILEKDEFALAALSKIHVQEVKNLLAAKLIWAQSLNIHTTFEADTDINQISLDPVTLVRMLGIILDNAIEELDRQDNGTLRVGCFKMRNGVTFIVQNTCAPDTPPLHEVLQDGFSTKGVGRGLGLQILTTLSDANENVFLKTSIIENNFTQNLSIENVATTD